jgi:hypothetical protein
LPSIGRIVLALLILIVSPIVIARTPTDIFPTINIPVIAVAWQYSGLNAEEHEVDNPTGEVLPGAYVVVRLRVGREASGLTIPANTLLFRSEGLRVAVVRDGRAELVPVKIGRDYGRSVEVIWGLGPTDAVILDPADSLVSGTAVRVSKPSSEPRKP